MANQDRNQNRNMGQQQGTSGQGMSSTSGKGQSSSSGQSVPGRSQGTNEGNVGGRGQMGGQQNVPGRSAEGQPVHQYLKNIDFPAGKSEILSRARAAGAPSNVIDELNELPDRNFSSTEEISSVLEQNR